MFGFNETVPMTPEARWKHLFENGQKELVFLETNEGIEDKPDWFDLDRFTKAREAVQKHLISIQYSSITGLLLILQLPEGLEPLLSTGMSKDILTLNRRYVATTEHVNSWYDDDVFNPDTKGYKSIRQVRAMHKRVQTNMNNKFTVPDGSGQFGRKWFNHYDVSLTQFAFIGLLMLHPEKCGAKIASKEELELINYYWRVLGHLMGVKDEYNLCQFENYDDIYQFCKLVFQHGYLDSYETDKCPIGLAMSKGICLAMRDFMPSITFNTLAYWWRDCFSFNGYEIQPLTTKERFFIFSTSLSFNHLFKNETLLKIMVKLHKRRNQSKLKRKDEFYRKLEVEFKDNKEHRFLSDRVEYFPTNSSNNQSIEEQDSIVAGVCPLGFGSKQPVSQTVQVSA